LPSAAGSLTLWSSSSPLTLILSVWTLASLISEAIQ
jgi:hypothetical protein